MPTVLEKRLARGSWLIPVLLLLLPVLVLEPSHAQSGSALSTLSGSRISEEVWAGDVIAVFFASWSPRCRDVVERTNELERAWGGRSRVILVDFQEDADTVKRFLEGKNPSVEVALDISGSLSKKHGVTTLPSLLVLKDGSVAFRGRFPAEPDAVLRAIFD